MDKLDYKLLCFLRLLYKKDGDKTPFTIANDLNEEKVIL